MALKSVADMKQGELGKLTEIEGSEMSVLLGSMGILPGTLVEVVRIAPFGGGCYIKSDGRNVVLRLNEAKAMMVKTVDKPAMYG